MSPRWITTSGFHLASQRTDTLQRRRVITPRDIVGIRGLCRRGQIDADLVRHEGERLLLDLNHALAQSRVEIHDSLTSTLKEYFDPESGRFQERVDRLIKQDGELEQLLHRQIGTNGSELAATLAAHIGQNSPLMKLINPEESDGLVSSIRCL